MAAGLGCLGNLTEIADLKIVHIAGPDPVPAGQNLGHLSNRCLHLVWSESLNVDLIYIPRQTLL